MRLTVVKEKNARITIPIAIVREFGWKNGENLIVVPVKGEKSVIIQSVKSYSEKR